METHTNSQPLPTSVQPTDSLIVRVVRAPLFLVGLALSFIPVFFIFASVSVGSWVEAAATRLGIGWRPRWLPGALGLTVYAVLGVAAPALLGARLAGWAGGVLAPLLVLGGIAVLGRW